METTCLFYMMPRIPTSDILQAYKKSPLLPLLLQECRTLESAENELRWLREHAISSNKLKGRGRCGETKSVLLRRSSWLKEMCRKRSRGVPLQYILGSQPFGDVDILCKSHVLIPRFNLTMIISPTGMRQCADIIIIIVYP